MSVHQVPLVHLSSYEYATRLESWVRDRLPVLNAEAETNERSLDDLVAEFRPWVDEAVTCLELDDLDRTEARHLIQLLSFGFSSVEKHFQDRKAPPGTGLANFQSAVSLLIEIARVADHPPRDSHYTYWLDNNSDTPLTFTGDRQEIIFNHVVNATNQLHLAACEALKPICIGEIAINSPGAVDAIQFAAAQEQEAHDRYHDFMSRNESGDRGMTPEFFMTRMRTYLPTYPVGGEEWGGVNAANLASQVWIDYLGGTVSCARKGVTYYHPRYGELDYDEIVSQRLRYMTGEDQKLTLTMMSLPSVLDQLLDALKLPAEVTTQRTGTDLSSLRSHLINQPQALRNTLMAYKVFFGRVAQLTAYHWSLIQNYLVKPAKALTSEQLEGMVVKPTSGTGGKSHGETEMIMRMRMEHPIAQILVKSL